MNIIECVYIKDLKNFIIILNKGDNINYKLQNGYNVLHTLCVLGYYEWIKIFFKFIDLNLFEINQVNKIGETPLFLATYFQHYEIVKFLLEKGANPNIPCSNSQSPLMVSILNQDLEIFKLLIEYNSEINYQNNDKETALHLCYKPKSSEFCKILLENNADYTIKNYIGLQPFIYFLNHGKYKCLLYFLDHGLEFTENIKNIITTNYFLYNLNDEESIYKLFISDCINLNIISEKEKVIMKEIYYKFNKKSALK